MSNYSFNTTVLQLLINISALRIENSFLIIVYYPNHFTREKYMMFRDMNGILCCYKNWLTGVSCFSLGGQPSAPPSQPSSQNYTGSGKNALYTLPSPYTGKPWSVFSYDGTDKEEEDRYLAWYFSKVEHIHYTASDWKCYMWIEVYSPTDYLREEKLIIEEAIKTYWIFKCFKCKMAKVK